MVKSSRLLAITDKMRLHYIKILLLNFTITEANCSTINQRAPLRRAPKNFIGNSLMFFPVVFLVCIIFLFNYLFQESNQVGAEMGESSDEELARAILPGLGGNALG